jgi:hypothetical protein
MTKKLATLLLLPGAISCFAAQLAPLPFDPAQLAGTWAESYNTDAACGPESVKSTLALSADGKRLEIHLNKKIKTDVGVDEVDHVGAAILSATQHTVVIRYDGETRKKKSGEPMEWELAIVAPGVYRWRETEWRSGAVNIVVGVRCSR